MDNVHVAHAATSAQGALLATGGRVLNVVATGDTFTAARDAAYEAIGLIELEGSHYRKDIAARVAND